MRQNIETRKVRNMVVTLVACWMAACSSDGGQTVGSDADTTSTRDADLEDDSDVDQIEGSDAADAADADQVQPPDASDADTTDSSTPPCELPLPEDVVPDSEGGRPFGFLDEPPLDSAASGVVLFRGWVLSPIALSEVALFVDDVQVAPIPLDVERPDVCAAFPSHACTTPGFSVLVDLSDHTLCHHLVEVRARTEDGVEEVIDRARLLLEPAPPQLELGEPEPIHSVVDSRITLALDMIVHESEVIACFGSWHCPGEDWDSFCRNLQTGVEQRASGNHETAGVGLAVGAPGVLIAYEADRARANGGPASFGGGILMNDGSHYWQAVSVGHGFAIAGAARISDFAAHYYIGEADGAGPWYLLAEVGQGVPHRQTFVAPYHLIFTMGYSGYGTDRLVRISADGSLSEVSYTGLPPGCKGVGTAEEIPHIGLVAGSYSGDLPWRGGTSAHVGRLDPETGATSEWVPLGGADVIDILPLDDEGSFAVSVNFPARVLVFDREVDLVAERALAGNQVGGLALLDGYLYASSAGDGRADAVRFPVIFP